MSPTRWNSHASAIALRSGSLSFFTTLSFSANAVRMFTGSGWGRNNVGRCSTGYTGARGLRWRWKDGPSGVPGRRVVDFAIIQWRRDRNTMGRRTTGYTPQPIEYGRA